MQCENVIGHELLDMSMEAPFNAEVLKQQQQEKWGENVTMEELHQEVEDREVKDEYMALVPTSVSIVERLTTARRT